MIFSENENAKDDKGDAAPAAGGCWVCHRDNGKLFFDTEYDTHYHLSRLEEAGVNSVHEYETRGD